MRTTTKSFAIALAVSTLLSAPVFAARNDGKHHPRTQDQQPSIMQRLLERVKHVLDVPIIPQPTDVPIIPQPTAGQ
jgi:hypothetical protein